MIQGIIMELYIAPDKKSFQVIFFFFLFQENLCCGYSLEVPHWGTSNEYHNICFHKKYKENISIFCLRKVLYLELSCKEKKKKKKKEKKKTSIVCLWGKILSAVLKILLASLILVQCYFLPQMASFVIDIISKCLVMHHLWGKIIV